MRYKVLIHFVHFNTVHVAGKVVIVMTYRFASQFQIPVKHVLP